MKRNSKRPGESCRVVCLCSPQSRLFCTVAVNYVEYWWNHVQSCGEKLVRTCGKPQQAQISGGHSELRIPGSSQWNMLILGL